MISRASSLLVALSAHGYGHLAQTAEVVNALRRRMPDLQVTVCTELPEALVRTRIQGCVSCRTGFPDVGMRMVSALEVDVEGSAWAYGALHADWAGRVEQAARRLRRARPTLLLANVPHLALAAARRAGIPAVAMCSLNWADIYAHYCSGRAEAPAILGQMRAAYRSASAFLQPQPSMPMGDLPRRVPVGPIARRGCRDPHLGSRLGLGAGQRLVLVAPGGVRLRPSMERWPRQSRYCWIVAEGWRVARDDVRTIEATGLSFVDLLASCDALVTKPGYGSFVEAACNGVPVLYVPRGDWPEEGSLIAWIEQSGGCSPMTREQWDGGEFLGVLDAITAGQPPAPVEASGSEQAAARLLPLLTAEPTAPDATSHGGAGR